MFVYVYIIFTIWVGIKLRIKCTYIHALHCIVINENKKKERMPIYHLPTLILQNWNFIEQITILFKGVVQPVYFKILKENKDNEIEMNRLTMKCNCWLLVYELDILSKMSFSQIVIPSQSVTGLYSWLWARQLSALSIEYEVFKVERQERNERKWDVCVRPETIQEAQISQ